MLRDVALRTAPTGAHAENDSAPAVAGNGADAAGDLPAGGRTAPAADVVDYAEGSIATGG
jgi:hypothetical protein